MSLNFSLEQRSKIEKVAMNDRYVIISLEEGEKKRIILEDPENSIVLWDIDERELVHEFKIYRNSLSRKEISHLQITDNEVITRCTKYGPVDLVDIVIDLFRPPKEGNSPLSDIPRIRGLIKMWDLKTKQLILQFNDGAGPFRYDPITHLNSDDKYLTYIRGNNKIQFINIPNIEERVRNKFFSSLSKILRIFWNFKIKKGIKNDDYLGSINVKHGKLVGATVLGIKVWDLETKNLEHFISWPKRVKLDLEREPVYLDLTDKHLVSVDGYGLVNVWDLENKSLIHSFKLASWVQEIKLRGSLLLAKCDRYVYLYNYITKEQILKLTHSNRVSSFDINSKYISTASDNEVYFWDYINKVNNLFDGSFPDLETYQKAKLLGIGEMNTYLKFGEIIRRLKFPDYKSYISNIDEFNRLGFTKYQTYKKFINEVINGKYPDYRTYLENCDKVINGKYPNYQIYVNKNKEISELELGDYNEYLEYKENENKFLELMKQFKSNIPVNVSRIAELTGVENIMVIKIIKILLKVDNKLGEFLELERVFIASDDLHTYIDDLLGEYEELEKIGKGKK